MKKFYPLFFFVAMFLVFDAAYSLLLTCQEVYPAATNHDSHRNTCSAFGGLVPWIVGIALGPLNVFLETYEHSLIAGFTIVLAFSTIALWWSTSKLWVSTNEAVKLAREEFIATHRPKVIVHAVDVKRFPDASNPQASELDKVGAILLCVNKGRGIAINVEVRGTTMVSSSVPDAKIQRPVIKTVDSLESGIKIWIEINTERAVQELRVSPQPMYFIGTISYFDKIGNRRETGFCYMFHPPAEGWMRIDAKTHDYAY
jgi:hypothetical protein